MTIPINSICLIDAVTWTDIFHSFFRTILFQFTIITVAFSLYVYLSYLLLLQVQVLRLRHYSSAFDGMIEDGKVLWVVVIGKAETCWESEELLFQGVTHVDFS